MMRLAARSLFLTMLCLSPAAAGAEEAEFGCTGPFGRDASFAGLVETFGASNVRQEDAFVDGETKPMTIVFPEDPDRRLMVHWIDGNGHRGIDFVIIQSPGWSVGGAAIGMPVADVQRVNGRPFKLTDFLGADNDGHVSDWMGGKLGTALPGGCRIGAAFGINDADADSMQSVAHADGLASDNEGLRTADPRLYELIVSFPKTEGGK